MYTDQSAFQMYSCNSPGGILTLKESQGIFDDEDFPRTIAQYGCIVLEPQDYIDGINNPAWGRKQIYGPADGPYTFRARYHFKVDKEGDSSCD